MVYSKEKLIELSHTHPILLFDGVCNLCDNFVQFVIRHDAEGLFRFGALQSEVGKAVLEYFELEEIELDSVILLENGAIYTHSDVSLRVAKRLGGGWSLLYGFRILPKALRDSVYNWIARNRYRWFGKKESCMMPTPTIKARFLS